MSRTNDAGTGQAGSAGNIKDSAKEVSKNIRDIGGQVKDVATEQYQTLRDQATEYYESGRERAQEWEQSLESYVQEKPIQSLLIAAGVGMLLGILWKRS